MRRLVLTSMLSAAAFVAAPAQARNGDFYIGADFGVMLADSDLTFTPGSVVLSTGTMEIGYERGFDGGVFAGYDLGPVRIEAEASYRSANADSIDSNFAVGNVVLAGRRDAGGGETRVLSFMGNAMLDLGNEDGLSFFVGGGAGYAKVDYESLRTFSNGGEFLSDRDWRFAWQGVAGVRQAISDNVDISVRYRFFNVSSVELIGFGGRAVEADFRTHSLMGGVTFNFW